MIAYHFPPLAGSSGIQRTLRFVQHLPRLGWEPIVLTAQSIAYEKTREDLLTEIPVGTVVRRAMALDTARHLQIGGHYLAWMARPDRWMSWRFDAIRQGRKLVNDLSPEVIWSTYPIATAHVIASALHKKTGLPWIADFRDPMAQEGYPRDPVTRRQFQVIESDAARNAQLCVFTTPGAALEYQRRYPEAAKRMVVLENGYDEESFSVASKPRAGSRADANPRRIVLLHSGIVYPSERDPTQLFKALGRLKSAGVITPNDLCLRFRAAIHDDLLRRCAAKHDAADFLELCPAVPYRDALAEMVDVDALLVMQASNCNAQIPAKIYEYLRAGRPIVALTDPDGDTAGVMRSAGLSDIARLDSENDIAKLLVRLVGDWRRGVEALPDPMAVRHASRFERSRDFANLLEQVS
jgi:Glycosyl transferase 4-like domain